MPRSSSQPAILVTRTSPPRGTQLCLSGHCVASLKSLFFLHANLEHENWSPGLGSVLNSCLSALDKPLSLIQPWFFFTFPMGTMILALAL